MIRCIIAGGRDFSDRNLLFSKCDRILQNQPEVTIISGGCPTILEAESLRALAGG